MNLAPDHEYLLAWAGIMSGGTFLLFGFDKWRAGRVNARRVAESFLLLVSALGGWPGGFLGIVLFRHKSAKLSFQLKFAAAFVVWAALVAVGLKLSKAV